MYCVTYDMCFLYDGKYQIIFSLIIYIPYIIIYILYIIIIYIISIIALVLGDEIVVPAIQINIIFI